MTPLEARFLSFGIIAVMALILLELTQLAWLLFA